MGYKHLSDGREGRRAERTRRGEASGASSLRQAREGGRAERARYAEASGARSLRQGQATSLPQAPVSGARVPVSRGCCNARWLQRGRPGLLQRARPEGRRPKARRGLPNPPSPRPYPQDNPGRNRPSESGAAGPARAFVSESGCEWHARGPRRVAFVAETSASTPVTGGQLCIVSNCVTPRRSYTIMWRIQPDEGGREICCRPACVVVAGL